ncbi:MAG: hypothetical protein SFZ23_04210 [Planctomycetota bacterium]|nr:hypothetical protein [Planctomycetota bacterium]
MALATRRDPQSVQVACVLGSSTQEWRADALGLRTPHRVPLPAGNPLVAARSLTRWLRVHGPFDAVVCWSPSFDCQAATRHAANAAFAAAPVFSRPQLEELCKPQDARSADGPVPDAPSFLQQAEGLMFRSHVAIEAPQGSGEPRQVTFRVVWLCDPPSDTTALLGVRVLGIVSSHGVRVTGIMPRAARESIRALRLDRRLARTPYLELTDEPLAALLAGGHAVLLDPAMTGAMEHGPPTSPGRRSLRATWACETALELGLPVVWPVGPRSLPPHPLAIPASTDGVVHIARALVHLARPEGVARENSRAFNAPGVVDDILGRFMEIVIGAAHQGARS